MDHKKAVKGLRNGDKEVLQELFNIHYKPLCSFLLQYTRDKSTSEDIVQEVFIQLWEKRKELRIKQSFKSYLYRAAYNAFIDTTRKKKSKDSFLDSFKYQTITSDSEKEEILYEEKVKKLKKEIDRLPPRCKQILLLSKQEGYKYKEIADYLDISIKTVEAQMRLAFQKLRDAFENDDLFLFLFFEKLGKYRKRRKII